MKRIYLDHNATTPVDPLVAETHDQMNREYFANPTSSHAMGREVHERIKRARALVAELLGCKPREIFFTGGGTEANNMAVKGIAYRHQKKGRHLITSVVDHGAVGNSMRFLSGQGFETTELSVDQHGRVSVDELRQALRPDTILVAIMHAQNEVGTLQPIQELAQVCREAEVFFHCDASQSVGKIPTRMGDLGVDLLALAGHKFYAPKGVGALFVRDGVEIEASMHGAGHEGGLRAGTLNSAGIVALGEACKRAMERGLPMSSEARDLLWQRLQQELGDAVTLNGHPEFRLPNTLNVSFRAVSGAELLARCEIMASTGAACHSGESSPVLRAMQVSEEAARGTVRLSTGRDSRPDQMEEAARRLISAYREMTS